MHWKRPLVSDIFGTFRLVSFLISIFDIYTKVSADHYILIVVWSISPRQLTFHVSHFFYTPNITSKAMKSEDRSQLIFDRMGVFSTDDTKFCSTDEFNIASEPELHHLMDWDTMLPRGFMAMSLLNSIRAIALSDKVIDDWHWKPVQQQHLIRRLEKPNFVVRETERAIVWAAVIMYEAYEVANWMMGHGFSETGVVPDDTSEWVSWVTQTLELEYRADLFLNSMVKDMKTRGCIGRSSF